jgi:ethanolaminephosphotransferase
MIPEYHYRVQDDSILTPLFKKWVVTPLFRVVPWWLPANIITIVSNLLMYIALYLAMTGCPAGRCPRFLLISLLIIGYTVGDHFDGMQAKRTKTSSALGELCDHFLDIFNNGIMLYIVCLAFQITNPALAALILLSGYLPHAAIFYEQFSTKWLYFEKIGSLESLLMFVALLLLSTMEPVYNFAVSLQCGSLKLIELVFVLLSSGAYFTFVKVVIRARATDVWFWVFCASLTAVACMAAMFLPAVTVFYIITAYSVMYIGNLQRGNLADSKKRLPDITVPLLMAMLLAFEPLRQPAFLWALYIYIACRALWVAGNAFWTLRGFWVWKNKAQNCRP